MILQWLQYIDNVFPLWFEYEDYGFETCVLGVYEKGPRLDDEADWRWKL